MHDEELYLSTYSFLEEVAAHFPNDTRKEQYEALYRALSKYKFHTFLTFTTRLPITDEIAFEGLCQRFMHQLRHTVIGKRTKSRLPIFTVIERKGSNSNGIGSFHAHILVANVIGETRALQSTTFRHYIQKRPFSASIKILQRLTYRSASGKTGRVGKTDFTPITTQQRVIDYVLKMMTENDLKIAWYATDIDLSVSEVSDIEKCLKFQK